MISLSRPFFTPVAILLRQCSGGFVVGFLPFLQTMLWFAGLTLLLLLLRGFAEGTWIGSVLDIPIARPMALLSLGVAVLWLLRATGLWSPHGPLRDHNVLPGFTGRAARFWSHLAVTNREWTVLEIYEPLMLATSGGLLMLIPWTRVAGGVLLLMAVACAYQTLKDLSWNERGEGDSIEDFIAGVLSSPDQDDDESERRPHVPDSPYADLSDDIVAIMDEDAKEAVEQGRATATPPPASAPRTKSVKRRRFVELRPRGAAFHRPGSTRALMLYTVLALGVFAVAVDGESIYKKSPDRWQAAILSVQTGAARLWLAKPADREQPGGLATAVLDRVAPDAVRKLRRDAVRREEQRVQAELSEASDALFRIRKQVEERLGLELDASSTTPQLDELILEHEAVAEAWVALINASTEYRNRVDNTRQRLEEIRASGEVDAEAYDGLFESAEPWDSEIDALVVHINHIASMLEAKQFEDALDRDPGG